MAVARSKEGNPCSRSRRPDLDYVSIAKSAPDVKVVVYLRTNRVKAAISRVRGKMLDTVCGYNNIRVGKRAKANKTKGKDKAARVDPRADMSTGHCKLNATIPVDIAEIKDALLVNWNWESAMLRIVDDIRTAGIPVLKIAYEHFLGDRDASLANLFDFLDVPQGARPRAKDDVYEKATSDDLKNFVPNYSEIEAWLSKKVPCLLSHLRETDPGAVFDQSCENPWPGEAPSTKA